jgi:hypothetical protein
LAFGAPFRWLPALLEAHLSRRVPDALKQRLLVRFVKEVDARIRESDCLSEIPRDAGFFSSGYDLFAQHSIIPFEVFARDACGQKFPLTEPDCRRLFEVLNRDASDLLPMAAPEDLALLRQEFHIGQPVSFGEAEHRTTVLRIVIGMRFFNIIAYNQPGTMEAALESEIADLLRAIEKLEILARNWWFFQHELY